MGASAQVTGGVHVLVQDEQEGRLTAATVSVGDAEGNVTTTREVENGEISFLELAPGDYTLTVSSPGFEGASQRFTVFASKTVELVLVMAPEKVKQELTVRESLPEVSGTGISTEVQREQVKSLPSQPTSVIDTLPLVPGVVRDDFGAVVISGAGEDQSSMLVNGADVTDPSSGMFGPGVPVDSVETVVVAKNPFLAQYGRFTAGVVSVETRRGTDKWHFELNDPLPEFRIHSLQLLGLKSMSPRVVFNGPLKHNKVYFAQSVEYNLSKNSIRTLPFPSNVTKTEYWNSFSQLDLIASPSHIATLTVHVSPKHTRHANLDFFNPQPVTPNYESQDYAITASDRLETRLGVLRSTFSLRDAKVQVRPQGTLDMTLTPLGNRGNYFNRLDRRSRRFDVQEGLALKQISGLGTHQVQFGGGLSRSNVAGEFEAHPVNTLDATGKLLKRMEFLNEGPYRHNDWEQSLYAQDHWVIGPRVSMDYGVRWERQSITGKSRWAPRGGISWVAVPSRSTTIRAGVGLFYERVPLNVRSFGRYPRRIVTTFRPDGSILTGPALQANFTDVLPNQLNARSHRSPHSLAWSIEAEQPVSGKLVLKANYLHSSGRRLLRLGPESTPLLNALVLRRGGRSSYRQIELSGKLLFRPQRFLNISYVRSLSRADFSEAPSYLGNYPSVVIEAARFTNTAASVPNRFLTWGEFVIPWKLHVYPLVEYRTGFPYIVRNEAQEQVGTPLADHTRFPSFFSLDASVARDFQVTKKYAVRLTLRGLNLTNRFNPVAVHSNTADPSFGTFFGSYNRRYRIDFDVMF